MKKYDMENFDKLVDAKTRMIRLKFNNIESLDEEEIKELIWK